MPLPTSLDPSNTLLFLGSGFSSLGTNIAKGNPPTGKQLAKKFASILEVPEDDELDLRTLANEMSFRKDINLYQTLYSLFTIANISLEQTTILSKKWLRIFTTNYDDTIEFGYQKQKIDCPSFSYNEMVPRKIPTGSIIHIHGTIRQTNEDNVLDQLVLNENSYIRQHFEKSPWYTELDRAIDHCSACFFVGYSLSDYHIAALLLQKPSRRTKIFFVTKNLPSEVVRRQIEQFGEIHPIGVAGFAELCNSLPAPPPITDLRTLTAFRFLDPFKDKKAVLPPTPPEIFRLVTLGDFNIQRSLTNLPSSTYVVNRSEVAEIAVREVRQAKTIVVQRWTRLVRQFGGLAKVDRVGFYAANFSIISAVA